MCDPPTYPTIRPILAFAALPTPDVLSSTAALLPARGIAENVLDGEAPAPADVLRTRDDLDFLVEKGIVVSTRNERGMKVYGLKEFFPNV